MKQYLPIIFLIVLLVIFIPKPIDKESLDTSELEIATLAGGCFWCVESDLEKIEGVEEVISGYAGGIIKNPTYKQVSSGATTHTESVQVYYNPQITNYATILDTFWKTHDPTDNKGQFIDRGEQYRPAVFYHSQEQLIIATKSKTELEQQNIFNTSIKTEITPFTAFYKAEDYHQDYYKKNEAKYKYYRYFSGRDQFLEEIWNNHTKKKLTPLQFQVTHLDATEPPFDNAYWDNKEPGIYVDLTTREPLFSSHDKFVSGTGWPSFTKPINNHSIKEKEDNKLFYTRIELRSISSDSHLGHVFDDGPNNTLRYCINSASVDFIHKDNLEEKGYVEYLTSFE